MEKMLQGLSMNGWAGMNFASLSPYEKNYLKTWIGKHEKSAFFEDFDMAESPHEDGEYYTTQGGVWLDNSLWDELFSLMTSLPQRVHVLEIGNAELIPAVQIALRGLNWCTCLEFHGTRSILTVQDAPNIRQIKTLVALS